jgi:hypothetical protein
MELEAPLSPTSCWPLRDVTALVHALEAGRLDGDLTAIIDAINDRTSTIARNRTEAALARLSLNDRVMIGGQAKPQYLRGEKGTVHEFDGDSVIVLLDRVVGKFTSQHLRCVPEMVEPLRDS